MKYLLNGFSPKMLGNKNCTVKFEVISKKEFYKNKKDCISAIGHMALARFLKVPFNRFNIQLEEGDEAYIISNEFGRGNSIDPKSKNTLYRKVTLLPS